MFSIHYWFYALVVYFSAKQIRAMDIHTTLDFLLVSIFRRQIPIKVGENDEFGLPPSRLKWNGTIIFLYEFLVVGCMGCDGSLLQNNGSLTEMLVAFEYYNS